MQTELTITRYNITAILGWSGIIIGLVGAAMQYFHPSVIGFIFLAVGLIGGAITVTFAGPLKSTTTRLVNLREVDKSHLDN